MIRWALHRAIDKFERDWSYDASYMRDIIDASPRAAWLFSRVTALGQFRRDLPLEAWCAAGITAVRDEDCGPCTQLGVTMAERAGVSPAVLRAVLADSPDAMPPDVALVWKFTRATLAHDAAADEYREAIVKRWGRRALVSLAFAITAARIYPTVKYALGHGKACMRIVVGGTPVIFDHGRVPAPVSPSLRSSEVGLVSPKLRSSERGLVSPKLRSSECGLVSPKLRSSECGLVSPKLRSSVGG